MALISMDEALGLQQRPEAPTTETSKPGAPTKRISMNAALGLAESPLDPSVAGFLTDPESWKGMGKRALTGTIAAADMVLGLGGQAVAVGAGLGGRLAALGAGESRKMQDLAAEAGRELIPEWATSPLTSLARTAGLKPYDQSAVGNLIEQGAEAVSKASGGVLTTAGTKDIIDTTMFGAMTKLPDAAIKQVMTPKIDRGQVNRASYLEEPTAGQVGLPQPPARPGPAAVDITKKSQVKDIFDKAKGKKPTDGLEVTPEGLAGMFDVTKPRGVAEAQTAVEASKARIDAKKTRMTEAARILGEEPARVEPIPLEVPGLSPLESGLAKQKADQGFLMTPEERITLDFSAKAGGRIVGPDGKPLGSGIDQAGNIDPRLLTALGIGSLAVWAALQPEDIEKLATVGVLGATMTKHGQGAPWVSLAADMKPYTLNLSKYIDGAQHSFSKQELTQKLGKVPKEEAAVIQQVLDSSPEGARISAKDLHEGVMERVAGWGLEPKNTSEWATEGLDRIDRLTPQTASNRITSTLYRLPEHMQVQDSAHFEGTRGVFGWTRSFVEDGKRHVVEIQSDLAQHAKELTPEKRAALEEQLQSTEFEAKQWAAEWQDRRAGGAPEHGIEQARDAMLRYSNQVHEINAALAGGQAAAQLSPIIKNWPRRIIREELLKAELARETTQSGLEYYKKDPAFYGPEIERLEQTLKAQSSVRFATADTVAKVEGWKNYRKGGETKEQLVKMHEREYAESLIDSEGLGSPEYYKRHAAARIDPNSIAPIFHAKHGGIYDRYAGEITRYLKGLGGKEVTDAQGHTWIEVPTTPAQTPRGPAINMFGAADPKLLAGVAAAAGLGAWALASPDDAQKIAILGALGTVAHKGSGMKFLEEGRLIDLAREGKSAAQTELYARNKTAVERAVRSFEKNGVDLDQVVLDTFESAFRHLDSFRGDAKFSTWLHRIAKNKALNAVEAQRSRPETTEITPEMEQTMGHGETPATIAQNKALGDRLNAAMEKVDPAFRDAFIKAEVEGMSYEAIAEAQGVPIGTVRSRISRAKEQLQRNLRDYADGDTGQEAVPKGQRGAVDPKVAIILGAVAGSTALGAVVGAYSDDPVKGAIVGGILGLGTLGFKTRPVQEALMRSTTRIANIEPALRRNIRDMEREASVRVATASDVISSFTKPLKKVSAEQRAAIEAAHKAADPEAMAAALKGNPALVAGHAAIRTFLRGVEEQLVSFGRFKQGIPDYLPLMVKDYEGLMASMGRDVRKGLEDRLHKANAKTILSEGRPLNEVERATIVNNYLLNEPSTSYLPNFAKHRRLVMTPERQAFYHDLETTLIHYAHAAVSDIARTTFFGQDVRTLKKGKQNFTNVEGSIGALTDRAMTEGRMTPEQAVEFQGILRARFVGGEKAPAGWLQDVRNVSGAALLGQIGSGLIQTSESLLASYHHGIRPAVAGLGLSVLGKGIKPREFGLANHVIEEVVGNRLTGKALSGILKLNLLATFDQLGIGTNLTASFVKNKVLAQTARGQAKIVEKWGADYGPDMPQLLKELQSSSVKSRSPLVDSLLWQELSDVRPTSRIEAPELFNAHPNARLAYHLKQFMLTQADILYRDGIKKIQTGEPKQIATGVKNIALYATALAAVAVPADAIKDWIAGRGLRLDKIDYVDNFIRNFGLSRYTLDRVRTGDNPGGTMAEMAGRMVTPPAWSAGKTALEGLSEPKKLVPFIPLGGRAYSDRYLGGNERKEISEKRFANKGVPKAERQQLSDEAKEYLRQKRETRKEKQDGTR